MLLVGPAAGEYKVAGALPNSGTFGRSDFPKLRRGSVRQLNCTAGAGGAEGSDGVANGGNDCDQSLQHQKQGDGTGAGEDWDKFFDPGGPGDRGNIAFERTGTCDRTEDDPGTGSSESEIH